MRDTFYDTQEWRQLRDRVRARDADRCTVARLLGGRCSGILHVHHIETVADRPDLRLVENNCATACAGHHRVWESLRAFLVQRRRPLPPCPHVHRYPAGREACDRRRRRELGIPDEQQLVA